MARVLASSRLATELLLRAPEAVALLGGDDALSTREVLADEVEAMVARHAEPAAAVAAVRAMRRRELFRVAVADLGAEVGDVGAGGGVPVDEVGRALTAVSQATVAGALAVAERSEAARWGGELPASVGVVAMGRLGGYEMSYASDADVIYVHRAVEGADDAEAAQAALAVAQQMHRLLAAPSTEPALLLDADLRPEGRNGPLVRSLASYEAYYARWGEVWERQALLRAEPLAGDEALLCAFVALVDPLRYAADGLTDDEVREVRRIKARVESERLPRGVERSRHLKLGPGGLADVEWTAQLLQLQHAGRVPALRTTRTVAALDASVEAGLLEASDRDDLLAAWRLASQVRNALTHVTGRAGDVLPTDARTRESVARLLGYPPGGTAELAEHWARATRRARRVVQQVFYGER
jgi:glutamate-ammonia-ligase adenylyltransferase